jgi:AraC-like DNA-binding protein
MVPAQADAFFVGLFTTIFRQCTGDKWDPREVLVRLGDPEAVPPGYHDLTVTRGDRRGPSIHFPQKWLLYPMHIKGIDDRLKDEVNYQSPPRSFIEAIRQALLPHLHRSDLTAEQAAKLCGYDRRVLGRKLKAMGSSLTKEIALLREEQASRLLKETGQTIAEVGNSVGYSDPSVFSRAFKKWTGYSPRAYRKLYRDKG